jgi:hypothetical protein
VKIVPFEPWHLHSIVLQPAQAFIGSDLTPEMADALAKIGDAYTALHEGLVMGCAGVAPLHPGNASAWAVLGQCGPRFFVRIHKAALRYFAGQDYRRIQTAVRTDFEAGHRWARALGFENEGTMRKYGPEGADYDLYARVDHG